ncbi:MAG: molybdenum cofactor biosynthesis enzyme, partial [Anaerotardibacter sp.]
AASSLIDNGFEYHYRIVAECAREYQPLRNELDLESKALKDDVSELFGELKEAFEEALSYRIEVDPPGKYGAVVLVVDTASQSSIGHFPSSFVQDAGMVGVRAALSSATLVEESSDEGKTIINSFFDGIESDQANQMIGPAQVVASLWSSLLTAYTEGHDSIVEGIEETLSQIPLASESGLAQWASRLFESLVESLGFEPPELRASKAVLVNSGHVLQADDSHFSATLLSVKSASSELNSGSNLFDSALSSIERNALKKIEGLGEEFEIATISFIRGAIEIPITIALPDFVVNASQDAVSGVFDYLRGFSFGALEGNRRWE